MVTLLRKSQISRVNARHLLDDLASSYSYSTEEAVVVELIANALDAECDNVYVTYNSRRDSVTFEDDGKGMGSEDFEKYHDLAESRKVRGRGIGFAGLGAKLAHKVASKVVTETRRGRQRDSSEWRFKGSDLHWSHTRSRTLQRDGTKVELQLNRRSDSLRKERFIAEAIRTHYAALLDPFLSEVYVWDSIYPNGVEFHVNGTLVEKMPGERTPRPPPPSSGPQKRTRVMSTGPRSTTSPRTPTSRSRSSAPGPPTRTTRCTRWAGPPAGRRVGSRTSKTEAETTPAVRGTRLASMTTRCMSTQPRRLSTTTSSVSCGHGSRAPEATAALPCSC